MLPFDNANIANFLNFNDVGTNTLKQSAAFAKIRANSKLFNTNIVTDADQFALKYAKINELVFNSNAEVETSNYGNIRQVNLTSTKATLNNLSTCLNEDEMMNFLTKKVKTNKTQINNQHHVNHLLHAESINDSSNSLNTFNTYSNSINALNDSTDLKKTNHVINVLGATKYSNTFDSNDNQNFLNNTMLPASNFDTFTQNHVLNKEVSNLKTLLKGENENILTSEQLIRNYTNLKNNLSNYNLSNKNNPIHALIDNANSSNVFKNSSTDVDSNISHVLDPQTFAKL